MDMQQQLEALLFSSGKAMEIAQLAELVDANEKKVKKALQALQKSYAERETALKLFDEGTSWKLLVKDTFIPLVRRVVADTELGKPTLETLAVIAYNQPNVLQSKVVELRGGNAYEHIKELVKLGFITKEKSGRSFAIRLTEKFYEYFDVEGADSIKKVFKNVNVPLPKEAQKKLGNLDVVDVPPEEKATEEKEEIGNLKVVDEFPDAPTKMEVSEEEKNERSKFLDDIEQQIATLTLRNDEREEDPDFQANTKGLEKPASEEEATTTVNVDTSEEREKEGEDAGEEDKV